MSIIKFDNGTQVQFNGTPSQRDIEEVAQSLGIELPVTGFMNKAKNFAMGVAQSGVKGVIGLNRLGNSIKAGIDPWHTTQDYVNSAPAWGKGLYFGTPEAQKLTDKFSATNKYQQYGQIAGTVAPYLVSGGVGMASEQFASRLLTQMFFDAGISGIQGMGENLSTKENLSMSALNTGLGMITSTAIPGGKAWEKLGAMSKFGRMLGPGYLGDVASGQMGLRGEDREGVNSLIPGFGSVMGALLGGTVAVGGRYSKAGRVESTIARREQQFSQLERDNRPFAKAMDDARASGFEPLNVLSRTNLIDDSVDTTGTIYTAKGLQKIESVLKPLEPVVYKRLVEDGTVITKKQFAKALQEGLVKSGFVLEERTQLLKKINQVLKSFDGDAVKGKLPLAKVQKAKISLGQKLSKQWGDPEKGQVNKALYEIYKEIVEKHTTSMDVMTFNRGLAELYAMRKVLLRLNGKKVEGGRLSKYTHQLVGGYAGASVGGAPGAILGAGVARYARGKQLKGALGGKLEQGFTGDKFENQMAQSMRGKSNTSQTKNTTKVKSAIEPTIPQKKGLFSKVVEKAKKYNKEAQVGMSTKDVSGDATTLNRATKYLREAKGLSASDIMKKYPDIQLKRDVPVTDIHGHKTEIPEGEILTPYELKGNKVLLQDGKTYVVSKNQFQNVKGQSLSGEAKDFAPELKQTQETVKANWKEKQQEIFAKKDAGKITKEQMNAELDALGVSSGGTEMTPTKYQSYQLPDGKDYKEILIKAPIEQDIKFSQRPDGIWEGKHGDRVISRETKAEIVDYAKRNVGTFKSSHWDEPNVISHLRLNERTYQGKKVTFMEELQSDWAREARKGNAPQNPMLKNWQTLSVKRALKEAVDNNSEYFAWINGEQTSARYNLATHIKEVSWKPEQLPVNKVTGKRLKGDKEISLNTIQSGVFDIKVNDEGVITSVDYGGGRSDWRGKKLDDVLGKGLADSIMSKKSGTLSGEGLKFGGEWANNLYDKQVGNIVSDLTGAKVEKLDMGLPIDAEKTSWYTTEKSGDYRGGSVTKGELTPKDMKVGELVKNSSGDYYVITDILGDGKFKAVPKNSYYKEIYDPAKGIENTYKKARPDSELTQFKETFDISTKKTTQQGIRLTPEVKAIIRGESPLTKKPQQPPLEEFLAVRNRALNQ